MLETNTTSFICMDSIDGWFKRPYVSYGACVQIFRVACRPLIFLDGTFLNDRYKGTLLVATAYGANNRLFPLAFCVYDTENEGNWDWFLRRLRHMLYEEVAQPYSPSHQLVFISNSKRGYFNQLNSIFPMCAPSQG